MLITPDQPLVDELMEHLKDALFGKGLSFTAVPDTHSDRSSEVHISDEDLCITRSFWEKVTAEHMGAAFEVMDDGAYYLPGRRCDSSHQQGIYSDCCGLGSPT